MSMTVLARAFNFTRPVFSFTQVGKNSARAMSCRNFSHFASPHNHTSNVLNKSCKRFFSEKTENTLSKAWAEISPQPIHHFSVEEFGISRNDFINENAAVFNQLPADSYDMRREQIEFLQRSVAEAKDPVNNLLWTKYYAGTSSIDQIQPFIDKLTEEQKVAFQAIQPFRWRAVSRFKLNLEEGNWKVQRVEIQGFSQNEALLENNKDLDWRKLPRYFSNIDDRHVSLSTFQSTLQGIAQKISLMKPVKKLDVVIHHIKVVSRSDRVKGNSPEGIHQDGYPFLVTALVVERENVTGGESQIFGPDKTTKVFTSTLFPGQGILQPDLGSGLWHFVTPVKPVKNEQSEVVSIGHRSIIGFDIDVIE